MIHDYRKRFYLYLGAYFSNIFKFKGQLSQEKPVNLGEID